MSPAIKEHLEHLDDVLEVIKHLQRIAAELLVYLQAAVDDERGSRSRF